MNQYIAKESCSARTISGKRVQIEAGKRYDGGFDFRDFAANRSVVFVKVNGREDEIHMKPGDEFISKFKYFGHVDKIHHEPVQIVKRPRIAK